MTQWIKRRWKRAVVVIAGVLLCAQLWGGGDETSSSETKNSAKADTTSFNARGTAPRLRPFDGDLPTRMMPPARSRIQRYLDRHKLSADAKQGLGEVMRMAADVRANGIKRGASADERKRYLASQKQFRLKMREALGRMTRTQRMALFRSRINVLQLARATHRQ